MDDALVVHEADGAEDLREVVSCRAQVERAVLRSRSLVSHEQSEPEQEDAPS